jgi:flagellar hook protein FlgE
VGFKSGQAQFADVFAASLAGAGTAPVGLGAKLAGIAQQFTQGNITTTNNPLDIAINGGGFFMVSQPGTSTPFYSRNGQFSMDSNSFIVSNEGYRLQGYPVDASGNILVGSTPQDIQVSRAKINPLATGTSAMANGVQANLNLDSREAIIPAATAFDYTNPNTYNRSTALSIYDSLGNAHTQTLYFKKTAVNTWQVYSTVTNPSGATPTFFDLSVGGTVVQQTLNFNTSGALPAAYTPATQNITAAQLGYPAGVNAMAFAVDFSSSTQYGSTFTVNSLAQDGYSSGELAGFNVGADGIIKGNYTNGQTKSLGQIALANFANPQGLQPQGNNRWAATSASGVALINIPGAGGTGVLQSAAIEDSNVDLTQELVNMITAQRVYQANAQTIKTQDSVLQTLVNLR